MTKVKRIKTLDNINHVLRAKREARGWTKSEMARQLGISSQLYGQYERDNDPKFPGGDFFLKWKQVFKSDLLSESHEVSRETKVSGDASVSDFKPQYGHLPETNDPHKIIADLAASSKSHGQADQDRAAAELLREQNNSQIIAFIRNEAKSREVKEFESDPVEMIRALNASISALRSVVLEQFPKSEHEKIRKSLETRASLILNKGKGGRSQSKKETHTHDGKGS